VVIKFPSDGLDKGGVVAEQPANTSPYMLNVRPYDVLGNRLRGGQRPGLDKLYAQQLGTIPIVAICSVTVVSIA
jgi:hypothetical protein